MNPMQLVAVKQSHAGKAGSVMAGIVTPMQCASIAGSLVVRLQGRAGKLHTDDKKFARRGIGARGSPKTAIDIDAETERIFQHAEGCR